MTGFIVNGMNLVSNIRDILMSMLRCILGIVSGVFGVALFLTYYKKPTPAKPAPVKTTSYADAIKADKPPAPKPRGPRPGNKILLL